MQAQDRSLLERLDLATPAQHERVGDMNQRRQIDVGHAVGDQFGEAAIDRRIFRLRRIDQHAVVMGQAAAAGGQDQRPGIGLDPDLPDRLPGLAPVEFGANGRPGIVGEYQIRRDRRRPVARK